MEPTVRLKRMTITLAITATGFVVTGVVLTVVSVQIHSLMYGVWGGRTVICGFIVGLGALLTSLAGDMLASHAAIRERNAAEHAETRLIVREAIRAVPDELHRKRGVNP